MTKSLRHLLGTLAAGLGILLVWQQGGTWPLGRGHAQAAALTTATCTWGGSTGNWTDAAKWLNCGGGVPGAADTAIINGGTVTVSAPAGVGTLQLNAGTIDGGGTLTVNNAMTWANATMRGPGVTSIAAGATIALTATSFEILDGRTLNNAGTATLNGTGFLALQNQGVFNNLAGSIFNIQGDAFAQSFGTQPNVFNNFGIVRKTAGISTNVGVVFNNNNLIEVQTGTLSLNGGGASSGPLNVSAGAVFSVDSFTFTLNAGAALNGAGTYQITQNGILAVEGNIACAGTFNHGGLLNGAGTFTANGGYNWMSGNMSGAGITNIPAGTTLSLTTASPKALDGRTLNNAGNISMSSPGFAIRNHGTFNNQTGGVFTFGDASLGDGTADPTNVFNNAGILRKTGSGATPFSAVLNNSGTLDIQAGSISLNNGGANSGAMNVAGGGTLIFNSDYTLNAGAALNGAGAYQLNVMLNVAGNVTCAGTFNHNGGVLGGGGTFTAGSAYNWISGTMSGSGVTFIPAAAALNLTTNGSKTLDARTLNNAGTTTIVGTGNLGLLNGATIINQAGALFDVQSATGIVAGGAVATAAFNNQGIFRKSAGGETIVTVAFNNASQAQLQAGAVTFGGQFKQTAGGTVLNGGGLNFVGQAGQLQGGTLSGAGTITGNLNNSGGTISPGLPLGTLNIAGTYSQGASGTMNIELGGTAAGTQYDRLAVTGAVALAGVLNVTAINGFVPAPGNNFVVASFGSRAGVFGTINLPSGLLAFHTPASVVLGTCAANTISPATLPNGTSGTAYNQTLTAAGGTASTAFSVVNGTLPAGLDLSSAGVLSGTPTSNSQSNFTIRALDVSGCMGEQTYTLTIDPQCPAITVNPSNAVLPAGQAAVQYNQTFTQTGGNGAVTFTVMAGALPNGLSLATGGALTGAPTAFGDFSFTVKATDANGCSGSRAYSLHVNAPCATITVNPASLSDGTVGTVYNQTATATGGTAPYTFTISAGALPGGLNLASGGGLTGTPNASGVFSFTVKATDANGCLGTRAYTVTIVGVVANNGLQFYPLPRPVRILDTRAGQGNCDNISTPINGGSSLSTFARLTCEGISIPANAEAVVGNVTILNKTAQNGYMTIYPDGQNAPLAASMIYGPNGILSNNFTVGLSANGNFNIFGERTIDAVVDISGYYAPPAAGGLYYHPLSKPIRLLDTRAGQGNCDNVNAPIAAGTSITTLARTTCEGLTIPQAAQAIVGVATVINGSGQIGYLTIYPNGVQAPLAANMVYFPGQILSNAFTVSLSASGEFNIFGERQIDMGIDVAGYYSTEANDVNGAGLLFTPLSTPVRLLDTRAGQGNCDSVNAPINAGSSVSKLARMTCEGQLIPNTAQAIIGNVTVVNLTAQAGYLTMYPTGQAAPLAANLIYEPGQILSNAFVVGLNGTGQFSIFAERTLDAIVDVSGFFAP